MPLSTDSDTTAWYRQFWPWFLIALPATVVVAALITVYIAFDNADTRVKDHYYRDGLAINQVVAKDAAATELGVVAFLTWDEITGEIILDLSVKELSVLPEQLQLLMLHPVDEKKDKTLIMSSVGEGRYRVDLDYHVQHRYYLQLYPLPEMQWRLVGEINFSQSSQIELRHQ